MSQRSLAGALADTLADGGWRAKARPEQLPPPGDDWNGWLLMAGRGFGKTRTGAEWVKELVETNSARYIALVGPTAGDVRDVMCEGPAGILAVSSPWCRPEYEPRQAAADVAERRGRVDLFQRGSRSPSRSAA